MSVYDSDILRLLGEGYCCAQIFLQIALDLQGEENPGLIRAMQGICGGGGDVDGSCGALTGGLCLLSYYLGRGSSHEVTAENLPMLQEELHKWFKQLPDCSCGTTCGAIAPSEREQLTVCPRIIGIVLDKIFSILIGEGVELDTLKEEL